MTFTEGGAFSININGFDVLNEWISRLQSKTRKKVVWVYFCRSCDLLCYSIKGKKKYLEAEGGRGRCKSLTKEAIKRTRLHYIMCAIIIKEFRERLSLVIFNSHIKSWKNLLRNTNQRSCARKRGNFVVDQFTSASLEHLRV